MPAAQVLLSTTSRTPAAGAREEGGDGASLDTGASLDNPTAAYPQNILANSTNVTHGLVHHQVDTVEMEVRLVGITPPQAYWDAGDAARALAEAGERQRDLEQRVRGAVSPVLVTFVTNSTVEDAAAVGAPNASGLWSLNDRRFGSACLDCAAGYSPLMSAGTRGECVACAHSTYKAEPGLGSCVMCPNGTSSLATGSAARLASCSCAACARAHTHTLSHTLSLSHAQRPRL